MILKKAAARQDYRNLIGAAASGFIIESEIN